MGGARFNFSAGPAVLPSSVLEEAAEAILDYEGRGLSLLEMSHRSDEVVALVRETELLLRELLGVSDDYAVLFLQGGASLQFSMVPLNLLEEEGSRADYCDTGVWARKAFEAASRHGEVRVAASSRSEEYRRLPSAFDESEEAAYFHLTSNNTIYGTQWSDFPRARSPLVADMSSDFLSRPIDVSRFGLLYAGAQKNAGTAGVTVVIVRRDLLARSGPRLPAMLDYRMHDDAGSLLNTPPVLPIFVTNRTLRWIREEGGLTELDSRNREKAKLLYEAIDRNPEFCGRAAVEHRSMMNVCFGVSDPARESEFLSFAEARGITGVRGHRLAGGVRASLYNAMPIEGVRALVRVMEDFRRQG